MTFAFGPHAFTLAAVIFAAAFPCVGQPAPPQPIPGPVSTAAGCIIQSNFPKDGPGNFETVVLQGRDLVHYRHDNGNVQHTWVRGQVITHAATGPGCLIQSDFGTQGRGNFEVVVPEGHNLVHYFHDNGNANSPWQRGQIISSASTGAASLIQSDFHSGDHGNFEVVVLEGSNLVHYFHDNASVLNRWQRGQIISTAATSTGTIIQSDFKTGGHGNFEVLVREGGTLWHYFHNNGSVSNPWTRGQPVSTTPGGAAVLIQSDFEAGGHGNFEALTVENGSLVHYFHLNDKVSNRWTKAQTIVYPASSVGGLLQSTLNTLHGNFEVALFAGGQPLHYWHDNGNVANKWQTGQVIAPQVRSQKVCQLTGGTDYQMESPTRSQSLSRYSVGGTDLGYPFEHDGRLYLLFGDTAGSVPDGRDSIAFSRDTDPDACPQLDWIADGNTFRPIQAAGVSLAYFEVPTTGFSANGAMYVFVWTDHKALMKDANNNEVFSNPLGHAALLRSDDNGRTYRLIWDRLGDNLIYLAAALVDNSQVPGASENGGQGLLIFGSGKYRSSSPYLAYVPLDKVEQKSSVTYFKGLDSATGRPDWGAQEEAAPLFQHPCVGELSVTWNSNLRQWMMLYNCNNPNGVVARVADHPWGPWSAASVLFDPATDAGSCYFIRGNPDCGPASDPFGPADGGPGGIYAPYVIPRFTRAGLHDTTIYYTLSTWNPYQVSLMKSTLALPSQIPFGPDACKAGFVWREALPVDHVCVTPASRAMAAQQNGEAESHRQLGGGSYGPDTCVSGFVWRNAFDGDHVCVTPSARQHAATDNTAAPSRRIGFQ
jgi:hypothetical protein